MAAVKDLPVLRHRYQPDETPAGTTPAERAARGRDALLAVPMESHAEPGPGSGQRDPVGLLARQRAGWPADVAALRYASMADSPSRYLLGAAWVMAHDLAATGVSGLAVQACGDAHLANFGLFATPERTLVFDIADFAGTDPGPWEWDVKRLATSIELAGREMGLATRERRANLTAAARRYRESMRMAAHRSNLAVWCARVNPEVLRGHRCVRGGPAVSQHRTAWAGDGPPRPGELTRVASGGTRIVFHPDRVIPLADLTPAELEHGPPERIRGLIGTYRRTLPPDRRALLDQYTYADMARDMSGTGPAGHRRWIVLLTGRDETDRLLLHVKETERSVLSRFTGASRYANQGRRVAAGQHLIAAVTDHFLGWDRSGGGPGERGCDFLIHQLRDRKPLGSRLRLAPRGLLLYGQLCAETLARAHARSGDRIAIAAYLGDSDAFESVVAEFATAYADQTERDRESLRTAIASGRVNPGPGT